MARGGIGSNATARHRRNRPIGLFLLLSGQSLTGRSGIGSDQKDAWIRRNAVAKAKIATRPPKAISTRLARIAPRPRAGSEMHPATQADRDDRGKARHHHGADCHGIGAGDPDRVQTEPPGQDQQEQRPGAGPQSHPGHQGRSFAPRAGRHNLLDIRDMRMAAAACFGMRVAMPGPAGDQSAQPAPAQDHPQQGDGCGRERLETGRRALDVVTRAAEDPDADMDQDHRDRRLRKAGYRGQADHASHRQVGRDAIGADQCLAMARPQRAGSRR